jgi:hypothetical protein
MKKVIQILILASGAILAKGVSEKELESMFDQDTETCRVLAQSMYPKDLNQQLDQFLTCLANQVAKLPEDENGEITDLKDTLKQIENNDLFVQNDANEHNLGKRDTDAEAEVADTDDDTTDKTSSEENKKSSASESRKWKKRNKRKRQKQRKDSSQPEADMHEDEEREKKDNPTNAFTNGLQFSAYSSSSGRQAERQGASNAYQPRPVTSAPSRQEQNMLMYGMDGQGNPQYIDEDVVSILLKNPQAKKAIMRYLSEEQPTPPAFNYHAGLPQETEGLLSDDQYSLPPYAPPRPPYSQPGPPYQPTGNQVLAEPDHRPMPPPLPRDPPPQRNPGSGLSPLLEYFGPRDYVPEVAHLVPSGQIKLPSRRQDLRSQLMLLGLPKKNHKSEYLFLEPKPRRKRSEADAANRTPKIFQLFSQLFSKEITAKEEDRTAKKKTSSEKDDVPDEQCAQCNEDEDFVEENRVVCQKCFYRDPECKKCRHLKFFLEHKAKCRRCMLILTTKSQDGDFRIQVEKVSILEKCEEEIFSKGHPKVCSNRLLRRCKKEVFALKHPEKCYTTVETIVTDEEDQDYDDEDLEAFEVEVLDVAKNVENERRNDELKKKCGREKFMERHPELCQNVDTLNGDGKLNYEQVALCADKKYKNIKKCKIILAKVKTECSSIIFKALNFMMCSRFGSASEEDESEPIDVIDLEDTETESSKFSFKKVHKCYKEKFIGTSECKKLTADFELKCTKPQFKENNFSMCKRYTNIEKDTEENTEQDAIDNTEEKKPFKVGVSKENKNGGNVKDDSKNNDNDNINEDISDKGSADDISSKSDNIEEENTEKNTDNKDPAMLAQNCKKLDLCKDLCVDKEFAKKFTHVCNGSSTLDEADSDTGEEVELFVLSAVDATTAASVVDDTTAASVVDDTTAASVVDDTTAASVVDETTTTSRVKETTSTNKTVTKEAATSVDENVTEQAVTTKDKQTIITNVINDIIGIVMEENKTIEKAKTENMTTEKILGTTTTLVQPTTVSSTPESSTSTTVAPISTTADTTTSTPTVSTTPTSTGFTTPPTTAQTTTATTAKSTETSTASGTESSTEVGSDPPAATTPSST